MMGRHQRKQGRLLYEFRLEDRLPENHLLRRMNVFVTAALPDLHNELKPYYGEIGRPSIDRELMIRMLIVGYCYGIRTERRLRQEVELHLAYRFFKLDLDDKVLHHSTFSENRLGRFRECDLLRHIFERVVWAAMAMGLVKGESFAVDASVLEANARLDRQAAPDARGRRVSCRTRRRWASLIASRYHGKAPDEQRPAASASDRSRPRCGQAWSWWPRPRRRSEPASPRHRGSPRCSVKDSTSPAVLGTYLERYPDGEFAPIARALIEHYERQLKAEVAAREQERKRLEEEKKAAEVKRLEQERRARQAALAEERRRAEEAKNLAEAKVVEEKQRAEWQARTEELRMALEEAWLARGAAKAADMERTAAVKAAEEPDVEASRAIRQAEVGAARTMIDRTEERFGLKPQRLVPTARFSTAIRPTPALRRVEEWGRACSRNRTVISLGYTLVTDNERDFAGVSGLSAENWLP